MLRAVIGTFGIPSSFHFNFPGFFSHQERSLTTIQPLWIASAVWIAGRTISSQLHCISSCHIYGGQRVQHGASQRQGPSREMGTNSWTQALTAVNLRYLARMSLQELHTAAPSY
jgi:hypothetical protein